MAQVIEHHQDQHYRLHDSAYFEQVSECHFDPQFWIQQQLVTGTEKGRGTTLFVQHNEHEFVLRHYLRGGLVSKFNKDKYLFKGWAKCRSIAEFRVLSELRELGLPVPKPVAAQAVKTGTRYQADILIERIEGASDLLSMLKDVSQSVGFYQSLAKVIAEFHKRGVYHADLNIQNILQDKLGQFWLIDFDRAKLLAPRAKWQLRTIRRLKRSFLKERKRHNIQWTESDWDIFEDAYKQAMKQ